MGYARCLPRPSEPRYLGHNRLGGWMVLALMGCIVSLAVSGGFDTTDRFWGSEAVENIHRQLAWSLLALVLLHLAGVVFTSLRHHENLVRAMVAGTEREANTEDLD